jgi:glycosyltransferase involved in cell wall biosynthesis
MSVHKPFFSIGVPTYNRKVLLKQTLISLLEQNFVDFEIIVGNDFTDEALSAEILGISDTRIRFINNTINVGELENMNSLLGMARGRYFTWQFDDDPVAPAFLNEAYAALTKLGFPSCVFTSFSFIYGTAMHKFRRRCDGDVKLLSGKDFIKAYLSGTIKALGSCGLYSSDYLKSIGGVRRLTEGPMALHSEYLLLIQAGLLPEVAYIDAPLVTSRIHGSSWTCSSKDAKLFKQAGINLIRESIAVFSARELRDDFGHNLTSVLGLVLSSVIMRTRMQYEKVDMREVWAYISILKKEFAPLKGTELFLCAVSSLDVVVKNIPRYALRARFKMLMPSGCLKLAHIARSIFSRYSGKAS